MPWIPCLLVCAATVLLVFVLPLAIPVPFRPTISASYIAGFNNGVAAVATATIGVAVLLWSWWQHRGCEEPERLVGDGSGKIGPVLTALVILATCTFCGLAGWMLKQSSLRYIADTGYFIEQMSSHVESGRPLYTGLEFAYGPLLFYPTVLLHHALRCGWLRAYFVTLAIEQTLGVFLVVYLLNTWPVLGSHRRFGLLLLTVGALNPLLGLNYTLFRFLAAFGVLTYGAQTQGILTTTAVLAAGEIVLLGISAEQGVAFLVATLVLAGLRAYGGGVKWLVIAAGPFLGACILGVTVGRPYFHMLKSFSKGTLSLPVAPYPHILVFLFAVVWLVPYALGGHLLGADPARQSMIACYAMGLGLLPAALGRCDPLHVFFNGAGVLLLSLACIRISARMSRALWLAALVVLVGWQQWVNNTLYRYRTADTLRIALMPRLPQWLQTDVFEAVDRLDPDLSLRLHPGPWDRDYELDTRALEAAVGNAPVATPLEITPSVEAALKRTGHYRRDYYAFGVDVFDAGSVARRNGSLNTADWMLLPTGYPPPFIETPQDIGALQGFLFPYPMRHPVPFDPGRIFAENLEAHWTKAMNIGPYTLFKNLGPARSPN